MWHCSPENCQNNFLLVRCAFWKKFSGANFCFLAFVSGWCFLVLFCLCFCFIMFPCSPESCLKKSFSCEVRVLEEIFGSELWFFCFGVRLVFFGLVLPTFTLYYEHFIDTFLRSFDAWDFVFSSALSLSFSLSLSFFPGGPARTGALFLCCSSSLF